MATTRAQLREIFYDILREEESDSSSYPTTLANLLLSSAQQRICNGVVVNPLTKEIVRKGQLNFLNKGVYYSNVPVTTLSTATTVGATTLTVASTTNFDTTGTIALAGNIITYTGKTTDTFTGCSGVLFAFKAGLEVGVVFDMPSDYASIINVTYNNKFKLNAKLYDDVFEDLNKYKGNTYGGPNRSREGTGYRINPFYTIIDSKYLVVYGLNDNDGIIYMRYNKIPTVMSDTVDATIDNDIYAQTTIPYLAVAEMLYNRGEEDRAGALYNFAMGQIREMYTYYNNRSFENINGTRYGLAKSNLNI